MTDVRVIPFVHIPWSWEDLMERADGEHEDPMPIEFGEEPVTYADDDE